MTNWPRLLTGPLKTFIRCSATADELEVGMGKVGMPLRVAVTGAGQSPALDVTVHAIGKTRSIERINKALDFIAERENQQ